MPHLLRHPIFMREYRAYHVYILSNKNRTTLYTRVTNDIRRRILEHKAGVGSHFTFKYNVTDLLYSEEFEYIDKAIMREKKLKKWRREWKMNLIKNANPELKDFASDWFSKTEIEGLKIYKQNEMPE